MSVLSFSVAPNTPARTRSRREQSRRLDDLRVVGSEYGAPIPVSVGTVRLAGQMIWANEIREVSISNTDTSTARVSGGGGKGKGGKKGGGGGGGAASLTSLWNAYRYYADFAVSFSAGVGKDILRLWADGNLIFDKTGSQEIPSSLKLVFRFYPGDETQEPDAFIESSVEGGQASAHRGLCYIVFEGLELTDFGNRIPSITAEIAFDDTSARPYRTATFLDPASTDTSGMTLNTEAGHIYSATLDGGLRVFDALTLAETAHYTPDDLGVTLNKTWASGRGGTVYAADGDSVFKIDGNTGAVLSSALAEGTRGIAAIQVVNPLAGQLDEYIIAEKYTGTSVRVIAPEFDDYLDMDPGGVGYNLYNAKVIPGAVYTWGSTFYWASRSIVGSQGSIYKGTIFVGLPGSGPYPDGSDVLGTNGNVVSVEEILRLGVADSSYARAFFGAESPVETGNVAALIYDPADHSLIFPINIGGVGHWTKFSETEGTVWLVEGPNPGGASISYNNILRNEFVSFVGATTGEVTVRSTTDGAVVRHDAGWPSGSLVGGVNVDIALDGETNAVYTCDNDGPAKAYLGRADAVSSGLGNAVATLAARAGLTGNKIDVSGLVGDVPGYSVADPDLTVRDILEPLMAAYRFDAVESDFAIKFVHLTSRTPVMGLVASEETSDLHWLDEKDGLYLEERRDAESELPQTVSVTYYDPARDYLQGEQHAQRPLFPTIFAQTENTLSVELPLAITAEQALASAWHILLGAWIARTRYRFRTGYAFLALDPLDVVQVTLTGRGRYLLRLNGVDFSARWTLEFMGEAIVAPTYQSVFDADGEGAGPDFLTEAPPALIVPSNADSGSGLLPSQSANSLADPGATYLFLLDSPLMSDLHSYPGRSVLYYAGVPANPSRPWGGADVGLTRDGETWQQFGRVSAVCGYGGIVGAIPGAPADPFTTDRETTITVRMVHRDAALESVSYLAMCNGANAAAILDRDGTVELIQYQTVSENDDGTFTLSALLRGRRGTEWACGLHGTGARLILLDSAWIGLGGVPMDDVGVALTWGALSDGQSPLSAIPVGHAHRARDLMPYAPVHLAVEPLSDGGGRLTWVRRTRLGGAWKDGTGTVPLSETTEEYEVDVLDPVTGEVVTAKTGLTAATVDLTYSEMPFDDGPGGAWTAIALTNPDAESGGSAVGWTDTTQYFVQSTREYEGEHSFAVYDNAGLAEAYQDVAVPAPWEATLDASLARAEVSWRQWIWTGGGDDWAAMGLEFLDGGGLSLGSRMAPDLEVDDWSLRSVGLRLPVGTRTIRVKMRGNNHMRIDAIALQIQELDSTIRHITVRVYQMSDAVGRGFPAEAVLTLE